MHLTPVFTKTINSFNANRITISQGGTSSGKTYSILQLLLILADKKPGIIISVVAKTLPHLKRGAMRDLFNILKSENIYNEACHDKSDSVYHIGNSQIEFFSVENPAKLHGSRRDYLFINEAIDLTEDEFLQLEIRTKKKIIIDFNPKYEFWAHEMKGKDGVGFVKSTYQDNDMLDDAIKKSIEDKRHRSNWYRVYGEGEIGFVEGRVFDAFQTFDEFPEYPYIFAMDFGYKTDPSTLIKVCKVGDKLYAEEMLYQSGLTTSDIIKQLNFFTKKDELIIADSAEPRLIDELRHAGFNIEPARKGPDSIRRGIANIQDHELYLHSGSKNFQMEINNYIWSNKRAGMASGSDHCIDPLRYALDDLYTSSDFIFL